MAANELRALCLTGPTATGKTTLALALAEEFAVEIVSMDSAMVYRGMDIGTAKPEPAVLDRVPHHLVDIRDPEDSYSAGRFVSDALRAIASIQARGKIPLVVGGTMLYLRALRRGLADLPERDEAIRAALDAEAAECGWQALHERLARLDPETAQRISPSDKQRIQRALEVHAITGQTLSSLQADVGGRPAVRTLSFALIPQDRDVLAARIERRFLAMVDDGLVDEVLRLKGRPGLTASAASMRAVGYRQIWAYLDGGIAWEDTQRLAVTATRQLAKRQLTWLRNDRDSERIASEDREALSRLRHGVQQFAAI